MQITSSYDVFMQLHRLTQCALSTHVWDTPPLLKCSKSVQGRAPQIVVADHLPRINNIASGWKLTFKIRTHPGKMKFFGHLKTRGLFLDSNSVVDICPCSKVT